VLFRWQKRLKNQKYFSVGKTDERDINILSSRKNTHERSSCTFRPEKVTKETLMYLPAGKRDKRNINVLSNRKRNERNMNVLSNRKKK